MVCVCACMRACVRACVHACVCMGACMCAWMCVCVCVHVCIVCVFKWLKHINRKEPELSKSPNVDSISCFNRVEQLLVPFKGCLPRNTYYTICLTFVGINPLQVVYHDTCTEYVLPFLDTCTPDVSNISRYDN